MADKNDDSIAEAVRLAQLVLDDTLRVVESPAFDPAGAAEVELNCTGFLAAVRATGATDEDMAPLVEIHERIRRALAARTEEN